MIKPAVTAVSATTWLLASVAATGAEYTADLGLDQRFEYDDNLRLEADNPDEVSGYTLSPNVDFDLRGEHWQLDTRTVLDFARFSKSRFDSDDQLLDATLGYDAEHSRFELNGEIVRDSTRTAEQELGIVEEAARRRVRTGVRPAWIRTLGERNRLALGATRSDVRYDSQTFADFDNTSFDATWTHILSSRTSVQVVALSGNFEAEELINPQDPLFGSRPASESDTLSLSAGLGHAFSEQLSGQFSVGARRVETTLTQFGFEFPEDKNTGGVATVEFTYVTERTELTAGASRSLSPSGVSRLLERDQVDLEFRYQLSERLRFLLRTRFLNSESVEEGDPFDHTYYRLEPRVRWQFNQTWGLDAGYRYRSRKFEETDGDRTDSNAVFVELAYSRGPTRVFR